MSKRYLLLVLSMILLLTVMILPIHLSAATSWSLIWSDEFNGTNGSAVDSTKWSLVDKGDGFGNGELQYYTPRTNNSYQENGNLVIKTIKESYSGKNYTSAKLTSQNKGDWTFGRFEMRAKLPKGRCVWPAFWMMPTNSSYGGWPVSGEIDIMELRGDQMDKIGGTIHFGNPWKYLGQNYFLPSGQSFADAFHIFAVEWDSGQIRWYVDGTLYETRNHTEWYCSAASESTNPYAPFDKNFYMQLNVAVGGPNTPYTGNQSPDDSVFPQYMYVDYVRAYKQVTTTPTPTPPSGAGLLSQGKTASASSSQTGNGAANGNDGNTATRWAASASTYPQWWNVDLGASKNLTKVDISWYSSSSRSYKYKIEVSSDNTTFTTKVDKTGNTATGDTSDSFTATGRYVRITVTGCSSGSAYASASEFKVYGN